MKKYYKIFILTGAFVFMLQLVMLPYLHNHPMDLQIHYDCPAYILNITLISFIVSVIISINLKTPYLSNIQSEKDRKNIPHHNLFKYHNKSPPII